VPGGTFKRSYDALVDVDDSHPATVSGFRLDKYEVTIGRFRRFVTAWVGGWRPGQGDGKHAHLNDGKGLVDAYHSPPMYESGWDTSWNGSIAATKEDWNSALACDAFASWTSDMGSHERHPVTCPKWSEAYAFCIWDGGFLPSEAEWNYAASGGSEQRAYPWSPAYPSSNLDIDCQHANGKLMAGDTEYCVSPASTLDVGTLAAKGAGKFGQVDLSGNAWEYAMDQVVTLNNECLDCACLFRPNTVIRSIRGGAFTNDRHRLRASGRDYIDESSRAGDVGFRCARVP
jgi:formylglycine-generating enzyme required for sulfatase activity